MEETSRNFRLAYYGKVGYKNAFRDQAIQEIFQDHIDEKKVLNFCQQFSIPSAYRCKVWQLLLKILPFHSICHDYISFQFEEKFKILDKTLDLLEINKSYIDGDINHKFLKLYLLENNLLGLKFYHESWHSSFKSISTISTSLFSSASTAYKVTCTIFTFFQSGCHLSKTYHEEVKNILQKENVELYKHMTELDVLQIIPFDSWVRFACVDIIHYKGSIEMIWDFLFASKPVILVYVSVSILLLNHNLLFSKESSEEILEIFSKKPFSIDLSQAIVKKALKLYEVHENIL